MTRTPQPTLFDPDAAGPAPAAPSLLDALAAGDGFVEGLTFCGLNLAELGIHDLGHAEFSDVTFESCSFDGVFAHRASFTDVQMRSCDLTGAGLRDSYWKGCVLDGCPDPRRTRIRVPQSRALPA